MGSTTVSWTALYNIRIIEVDHEGQFVMASWNSNTFTHRVPPEGKESFSCESLTQIIQRLHTQAGVEGGSSLSALCASGVNVIYDLKRGAI